MRITGSGQLISRSPFIRDGDCKKIGHKKTSLCAQEGTKTGQIKSVTCASLRRYYPVQVIRLDEKSSSQRWNVLANAAFFAPLAFLILL